MYISLLVFIIRIALYNVIFALTTDKYLANTTPLKISERYPF